MIIYRHMGSVGTYIIYNHNVEVIENRSGYDIINVNITEQTKNILVLEK